MLTIAPPPAWRISVVADRANQKGATRLTSTTRSKSSVLCLSAGAMSATPALLTSPSMCPKRASAACTKRARSPGSTTSQRTGWQLPPRSAASCCTRSERRAARTVAAPARVSAFANWTPSPELAPVTMTTCPSRRTSLLRAEREGAEAAGTVDGDLLAGDVAGLRRHEVGHERGHFGGLAEPAGRQEVAPGPHAFEDMLGHGTHLLGGGRASEKKDNGDAEASV